jgi:signal transduction histidine kinase
MAARHNASMVQVDLGELAGEVLAVLRHSPRATGRTVRSEVPAGLAVRADPDGLRHVLFNLLSNALEATLAGGSVTVLGKTVGDEVHLAVEDTGPGLAGDPARCFEAFFTTKKNGTGLGLSVVRKVVEAHGGRVSLENRKEGGCRASVVLPRRISA